MARNADIWRDKSLLDDLGREVRNYNRRVRNFARKNPGAYVPETISLKQAKAAITNKRQYNKVIGNLRAATYKNLVSTKRAKSAYQKRIERQQRAEKERQKKKTLAEKLRETLKDFEYDKTPGKFPTDAQKLANKIGLLPGDENNYNILVDYIRDHPKQIYQWRENYLTAIDNAMQNAMIGGDMEGVEALKRLYQRVVRMPLAQFLTGQLVSPEELGISYVYPVPGQTGSEYSKQVERIMNVWDLIS